MNKKKFLKKEKRAEQIYQKLKKTPVNNYLQKKSFAGYNTNAQMINDLRDRYDLSKNQTLKIAKQYFNQFRVKGSK